MHKLLEDNHGRKASYMRISVTDRCNLRCTYCAGEGQEFVPHSDILRYEEILELMDMATRLGMVKFRFTGGEPFVRKGFADFLIAAAARFPGVDMCVTTNATLIGEHVDRLASSGVRRVNISLDTLDPEKFHRVTGFDKYDVVRANIDRCLDAGMVVKVNAVAMKGINDGELPGFIEFARSRPLDMRFIEFMPVGLETGWSDHSVWKAEDILAQASALAELVPSGGEGNVPGGPARTFDIVGGQGRIGVISPYTNHFCNTCNRLRVTSDGNLRTCLFSDKVYRLRKVLRHPRLGIPAVERIILCASRHKPMGYKLLERMVGQGVCKTRMASIGG
ncbi:MAG: GTP 3',8-cyclase MoaA [Pseudodesulfovibrio sp.]|uniref:GTP 3',8-cyclase n=1 Tax=Pseudodesulfovibrio aespoeensis (strain ATCC 700646 / DSM 10631 / Aspo-2) TaxID=643562 RepID=E6VS06_PSEA9|nr:MULTISPECIES: GTP 3',8-cyclase MoaA [Pseudodesulfovibrio]MBU4193096.1 GTP 3',8-cyclase MoaA [Pseudomonadota bacterium]ADU61939.1 molybdenum cofactor biosynthesis protein A [Pseudodesulfovibrio aespoeensis Aspo-2]MBU4243289.1 GTP 3',8-cyclase MoaA [Pseudomonadota bacterium]MBU4379464.1 GTP 3',8-cyclase MoaA [Pseudomonadota bacterium]MBU4473703.1 GTP 3',8-cyclase MoaA [Pseudomonadota bacterium]